MSAPNPPTYPEQSPIRWIDSHCHLQYDFDGKTSKELVQRSREHGVREMIAIATKPSDYETVQSIARQNPGVYYTLGTHPHETSDPDFAPAFIRAAASDPLFVAVGELGLDYYYKLATPDHQLTALEKQLELAVELKKPVVIHSRDAEQDLLPLLANYSSAQHFEHIGVIHCFTGSRDFAESCINLGFSISLSGILTFKSATELRETVRTLPLSSLLIETDSPYLAPIPHRGKKAEPFMILDTAKVLAELFHCSVEEIGHVTSKNTVELFRLPGSDKISE
jgi:TatD DNase family protein